MFYAPTLQIEWFLLISFVQKGPDYYNDIATKNSRILATIFMSHFQSCMEPSSHILNIMFLQLLS